MNNKCKIISTDESGLTRILYTIFVAYTFIYKSETKLQNEFTNGCTNYDYHLHGVKKSNSIQSIHSMIHSTRGFTRAY